MFIDVKVEPVVGCIIAAESKPVLENGRIVIKRAVGPVVEIRTNRGGRNIYILKDLEDLPFESFRVVTFTFGGVMVPNPEYDPNMIKKANDTIVRNLMKK